MDMLSHQYIGSAEINVFSKNIIDFKRFFFFYMELFALNLLLFYIDLSFGFWITLILKKESTKIESLPPSADLALDGIYIYIYIYNEGSNGCQSRMNWALGPIYQPPPLGQDMTQGRFLSKV